MARIIKGDIETLKKINFVCTDCGETLIEVKGKDVFMILSKNLDNIQCACGSYINLNRMIER